ncbi:hypothetical protein NL676_036181 [Syzygium grande]|nr:hypothetical protein NL676_036181 [Syzygium grande]
MADVSSELKSPFILPRFSLILGSVWSRIEISDGESFVFAIFNSGTKGFRREDSAVFVQNSTTSEMSEQPVEQRHDQSSHSLLTLP